MDSITLALYADIPITLATGAHAGTSHVPDTRGRQEVASYVSQLVSDLEMLTQYATTDDKRATLSAEFARYRDGYRTRYLARLSAMSRVMSTMVTGGSNFPTARNRKRGDAADKRTSDLIDYRERALAAIKRKLRPELAPVMAGDADAVPRLETKIEKAERLHAIMIAANAAIRKHAKAGADAQVAALVSLGISEKNARNLLVPDFAGRIGFADYQITNSGANLRRMKARTVEIAADQATPATEIAGELARFEDAPADNLVRLFYPGKPDAATRGRLKAAAFRWAPSLGCWQAYRNHHALTVARREAGIVEAPAAAEVAS